MSCSLCRLPFTPGPLSVDPHPPPDGALSARLNTYFRWGVAMGEFVPGAVSTLEWLDNNSFGSTPSIPVVLNIPWVNNDGTVVVFHTVCAAIVRAFFHAEGDTVETFSDLCQIEKVLGHPQGGLKAGRFRDVNYEGLGEEQCDLRLYWKAIPDRPDGWNAFEWGAFVRDGPTWLLNRPDVFPKFYSAVSHKRLPTGPLPTITKDLITKQSLDFVQLFLPHLSDASFVSLLSTCRLLRYHALTTFQPQARRRVLDLGWAVPLAPEFARAARASSKSGLATADTAVSPPTGDWFLYLSQVHSSPSMRVRRHLWALAGDMRRVYVEKLKESPYAGVVDAHGEVVKSPARERLEEAVGLLLNMAQVFSGVLPPSALETIIGRSPC